MSARILVGSCSWTDPSLISSGRFYPTGVSSPEARLRYYATQFPIVEVDATYYAPPSERNSRLWAERTPDDFVFDVKAFALLTTHHATTERLPAELRGALPPSSAQQRRLAPGDLDARFLELVWDLHRRALAPLAEAGKLGAVLFQFPPWFTAKDANRDYLRTIPERLPGLTAAVEFRGGGWMEPGAAAGTLALLGEAGLAYVCVDEPQVEPTSTPPVVAATAPLGLRASARAQRRHLGHHTAAPPPTASSTCTTTRSWRSGYPRWPSSRARRPGARALQQQLRGLGHAQRAAHGPAPRRGYRARPGRAAQLSAVPAAAAPRVRQAAGATQV